MILETHLFRLNSLHLTPVREASVFCDISHADIVHSLSLKFQLRLRLILPDLLTLYIRCECWIGRILDLDFADHFTQLLSFYIFSDLLPVYCNFALLGFRLNDLRSLCDGNYIEFLISITLILRTYPDCCHSPCVSLPSHHTPHYQMY